MLTIRLQLQVGLAFLGVFESNYHYHLKIRKVYLYIPILEQFWVLGRQVKTTFL